MQTWKFDNGVYINSTGTAVGPLEMEGPLKDYFDVTYNDLHCEQDNWEQAERQLLEDAINELLKKERLNRFDIDLFIAGDLLNQTVTSNYAARDFSIPFLGMYNACSTMAETLLTASALINAGYVNNVIVATSSHNATAERQYRYPTEYGGQKPDTATFTVTGAGAALVSNRRSDIKVESATVGRVLDLGQKNPMDMGSAMAPAAKDTIKQHLEDLNRDANYYDLIVTGDLSKVGSPILVELLQQDRIDIENIHNDCGLLVFDTKKQPVFAGGSGAGCASVVTYSYIVDKLRKKELKKVLVVATGALFNPIMMQQKETIPVIAHAVSLEAV